MMENERIWTEKELRTCPRCDGAGIVDIIPLGPDWQEEICEVCDGRGVVGPNGEIVPLPKYDFSDDPDPF